MGLHNSCFLDYFGEKYSLTVCNNKGLTALFLMILVSITLYGQDNDSRYTYAIGGSVFKGFIYRHTSKIAHLITDHPGGFEIYAQKNTYGNREWQSMYNYPDIGISLVYIDYNNDQLGKSIGALLYNDFYLTSHRNKNYLKWKIGGGLGYHSNHYDIDENPKNNILSTDFSYSLQTRLEYGFNIKEWTITSAISLTHFSNAAIKKPNKGVNVISLNLGALRNTSNYTLERIPLDPNFQFDRKVHFNMHIAGGFTSTILVKDKKFLSMNVSMYMDKRVSRRSILNGGLDFFANYAFKEQIRYDQNLDGPPPDFKRIGIMAGYELYMGRTAILIQMGYYIYSPYEFDSRVYQRYGFKYHITDHLFASIYLKALWANAEMAEWAIGFRI